MAALPGELTKTWQQLAGDSVEDSVQLGEPAAPRQSLTVTTAIFDKRPGLAFPAHEGLVLP